MKLRTLVLVVSAAALASSPAFAVGTKQLGVEVGASLPSGNFGNAASKGFNVGGEFQYQVDRFGAGCELKYHSWGASTDLNAAAEAANGSGSEYHFNAWQGDVFGIVNLPIQSMPSVTPFVKFGAGWYAPNTKLTTPSGDFKTKTNDFGIVGGLGFDFNTHGPMKLGLTANYHRVRNSETDFMSFSARIMYPLH